MSSNKRSSMNRVVLSKRKHSFLEILANTIIYIGPLILISSIFAFKFDNIVHCQKSVKIEFAFLLVLIVMFLVYYKILKRKVKEKLQANKINQEKNTPVLIFCNTIFNLMPYAIILLAFDFLQSINEPIHMVVISLLIVEGIGNLLLFIDSFREAQYE
jgi:low temperature requirement protein LtrA